MTYRLQGVREYITSPTGLIEVTSHSGPARRCRELVPASGKDDADNILCGAKIVGSCSVCDEPLCEFHFDLYHRKCWGDRDR